MQGNLEVLISFVIVIIGLSVFLQIVTEAIKNVLNLRWKAYEKFFRGLYLEAFASDRDQGLVQPSTSPRQGIISSAADYIKTITKGRKIGSVTFRFKDFSNCVISLSQDRMHLWSPLIVTKKIRHLILKS